MINKSVIHFLTNINNYQIFYIIIFAIVLKYLNFLLKFKL